MPTRGQSTKSITWRLNQQKYLRKGTKMITYISDPHSKLPNNETKLNDTKTYSSTVLCEKHAIDWNKSSLGGVLETKQWRKWNTRNEMKLFLCYGLPNIRLWAKLIFEMLPRNFENVWFLVTFALKNSYLDFQSGNQKWIRWQYD